MSTVDVKTFPRSVLSDRRPIAAVASLLQANAATVIVTCMVGIGLVAAYDFYLTIVTARVLPEMERNKVGRMIMGLDDNLIQPERIALFLALKFAGTVVVLSVLGWLGMVRDRRGVPVAIGVLTFQLGLLYVLCDPTRY
ncbi:hypothetical protein [Roseimaritima sediminicola]|uniref:hypothetical protein n=1 Tax=Roseimaritima sediminicola TaxID=2662066 RepID=UPI00129831CB|nr:hypothetical protein [Roseimaritima sediminicola]